MILQRYTLTSTVTITWPATWSEVIKGPAAGAVATPLIPAGPTGPVVNTAGFAIQVAITGGTVPVVAVNGTTVATATGATVVVPIGGYIAMTYSSAPTWVWSAAVGGPSAGIGEGALVSGTAPVGGQAGVLPQYTFLEGTAIDPAGPLAAAIRRSPRSFTPRAREIRELAVACSHRRSWSGKSGWA